VVRNSRLVLELDDYEPPPVGVPTGAKFSFTAARARDANHDMTAVKRVWRGRGVAGALKRAQIAWAKGAGYERLVTQNEVRNEPIRRLNERLGYRLAPGRIVVRGPVSGH
jgi:GNAT superfamily N-acetyltransferase